VSIEKTFGDPNRESTACAHPGMTTEEYMANFEMLTRQTSFNESALEMPHLGTPSIHPFEGLLSDISPIWPWTLEGNHVQPGPPSKEVC